MGQVNGSGQPHWHRGTVPKCLEARVARPEQGNVSLPEVCPQCRPPRPGDAAPIRARDTAGGVAHPRKEFSGQQQDTVENKCGQGCQLAAPQASKGLGQMPGDRRPRAPWRLPPSLGACKWKARSRREPRPACLSRSLLSGVGAT